MEKKILRDGTVVNVMCSAACAGQTCKCRRVNMKREYLKLPGRWRLKVRKAVYAFFRQNPQFVNVGVYGNSGCAKQRFFVLLKENVSGGFRPAMNFIREQIYSAKSDYRTENQSK